MFHLRIMQAKGIATRQSFILKRIINSMRVGVSDCECTIQAQAILRIRLLPPYNPIFETFLLPINEKVTKEKMTLINCLRPFCKRFAITKHQNKFRC